jgi:hypothetical protein
MSGLFSSRTTPSTPQRGMVSIFVTLIMMIVISMIVLGFSQISRHELRQALDRNLSTQAYYAAETGVNDAINSMYTALAGDPAADLEKPTCAYPSGSIYGNSSGQVLNAGADVKYSCLMVRTSLPTIKKTVAADGTSETIPLRPVGGTLGTVRVKWMPATAAAPFDTSNCPVAVPAVNRFPKNLPTTWRCPYGVLRLDLLPVTNLKRASLEAAEKAFFLYPVRSGAAETFGYATAAGSVVRMLCTATDCTADITIPGGGDYAMRAMGVYQAGKLEISATSAGNPVLLQGAQAEIDVTGKAQDVLRRIQVRVSLAPESNASNYAIESASSICKRFAYAQGTFRIDAMAAQDDKNPMCNAMAAAP